MKPLHNARHATEAHLIRGYLESHGIAVIVRGEFLAGGIGELPADVCGVWVVHDHEFTRANELIRQWLQDSPAQALGQAPWQCDRCHETLEAQFTACWRCGAVRAEHPA